MKTKTAAIPNNYSLFRTNYSDICRTTRQLLVFQVNYSFLPSTIHFYDYPE